MISEIAHEPAKGVHSSPIPTLSTSPAPTGYVHVPHYPIRLEKFIRQRHPPLPGSVAKIHQVRAYSSQPLDMGSLYRGKGVAGINDQGGVLSDGGVVEGVVVGDDDHAIGEA